MADPVFALVDCNNFYASCERVFQPRFEGKPIIVLSNNDGCVIARSNEAKALGFAMGDPFHLNRQKIKENGVAVFSSNYTLYGDMSRRVMNTLADYTPELEIYSIDEAFMNLAGFEHRGLSDYARQVRAAVRKNTGIPVSIGIGNTKTLAKIANRLAKKIPYAGGVFDIAAAGVDASLAMVEVGDVWGIGRQWATWLQSQGIATAYDLKRANAKTIRQKMTVVGERIVHELNGVSCIPLELMAEPQKGITVSRSFGQLVTDLDSIKQALLRYIGRATEKLRRQGLMTQQVMVFANTNRFDTKRPGYSKGISCTLPFPTDFTPEIIHYAVQLLEKIYRPGYHFQKCGIMLMDLSPACRERRDMFDMRDQEKQARLMKAMDAINRDYGQRMIHFGDLGGNRPKAAMRSAFRSPRFTTSWDELPTAH